MIPLAPEIRLISISESEKGLNLRLKSELISQILKLGKYYTIQFGKLNIVVTDDCALLIKNLP